MLLRVKRSNCRSLNSGAASLLAMTTVGEIISPPSGCGEIHLQQKYSLDPCVLRKLESEPSYLTVANSPEGVSYEKQGYF